MDGDTCFFANLIFFCHFLSVFAPTLLPVSLKLQLPYLLYWCRRPWSNLSIVKVVNM